MPYLGKGGQSVSGLGERWPPRHGCRGGGRRAAHRGGGCRPGLRVRPGGPAQGDTVTITAQRVAVCDLALPLQTPAAASAFSQAQGSTSLEGASFARSALV